MPTSAEHLLLDTSVALALVNPDHTEHRRVRERCRSRRLGLAGHARAETYSVLTRWPPPQRLSPTGAARLIRVNFPHSVTLGHEATDRLLDEVAAAGIAGGAVYDALVGAAAAEHGRVLLTTDARAVPTYRALGTAYELIG